MPGNVDAIDPPFVRGWARHPRDPAYPVVVHAIAGGQVAASTIADIRREDGMPGFALHLRHRIDITTLRVLVGETDEVLNSPRGNAAPPTPLTIEALAATLQPRPWISGVTFQDALESGLKPQTVIDLLCRDFLGRPAGPGLVAATIARGNLTGLSLLRRAMLTSAEYFYRRIDAGRAPGAVFSQAAVLAAAAQDFVSPQILRARPHSVALASLTAHDGPAFVTECYRRLLRKDPDAAGLAHYISELAHGTPKTSIVRHLSEEFECLDAGIAVSGL